MQPFIQDIAPKRTLRATVFRSPYPKGTVRSLGRPSLPRGYVCIGHGDIPGSGVLSYRGYTIPVLAKSQVRYLGEPLLLFCGPDPEVLAHLRSRVELSFEEQAPVKYTNLTGPYREAQIINLAHGDVDLAFSLAEQIVEGEYQTGRQEHYYPDTQGAVADWDGKTMTVHAATQDPHGLQAAVAGCLNLSPRKIRVVAAGIGNSNEGKLLASFLVAAQASLLALAAKKPVVLVYDRGEDLCCSPKGPGFYLRHQTALDQDGGTMAVRVQILMDGGCYPPKNSEALHRAVHAAWGAYRIPNLEVTGRTLETDFSPIGPFRASGLAQAFFAAELHSSRLEEVAQLDPYNWKRANLVEGGPQGSTEPARTVLDEVTGLSDFVRKYSAYAAVKKRRKTIDQGVLPLRGIGLSLACQGADEPWAELNRIEEPRRSGAMRLVLEKGRRLRIYTSLVDAAMGIHEILVRRAAELLGLEPEKVTVQTVDTRVVPDTGPTTLSRAVAYALPLLEQCCAVIQRRRKDNPPPIEVRRSLPVIQPQAGKSSRPQRSKSSTRAEDRDASWAAAVVEVELDPVSFQSTCRGVWMVVDMGKVWSRTTSLGVLEGEILRCLGATRLPGYAAPSEAGTVCSATDLIAAATQLPEITIRLAETREASMLGFEALPHLTVPAAYAAAICQATGLYIDQLPITAEAIQQCLET